MNISTLKLGWKFLTGGKEGVIDYIFSVANNYANGLASATKDEVAKYLTYGKKILSTMKSLAWLCPAKWETAYTKTIDAFEAVVTSLDDLNLTEEERSAIVTAFKVAYSEWMAD